MAADATVMAGGSQPQPQAQPQAPPRPQQPAAPEKAAKAAKAAEEPPPQPLCLPHGRRRRSVSSASIRDVSALRAAPVESPGLTSLSLRTAAGNGAPPPDTLRRAREAAAAEAAAGRGAPEGAAAEEAAGAPDWANVPGPALDAIFRHVGAKAGEAVDHAVLFGAGAACRRWRRACLQHAFDRAAPPPPRPAPRSPTSRSAPASPAYLVNHPLQLFAKCRTPRPQKARCWVERRPWGLGGRMYKMHLGEDADAPARKCLLVATSSVPSVFQRFNLYLTEQDARRRRGAVGAVTSGPFRARFSFHYASPFADAGGGGTAGKPAEFTAEFSAERGGAGEVQYSFFGFAEGLVRGPRMVDADLRFDDDLAAGVDSSAGCSTPTPALRNKYPAWNEASQCWALDFEGRVKRPSMKNFQLTSASASPSAAADSGGETEHEKGGGGEGSGGVWIQFGSHSQSTYIVDYDPARLSATAAFALALTAFESKLGPWKNAN